MGKDLNSMGEACAARALSNCPIPWVKHEAANAGNPCINQLISIAGMEGYGRFWRLVELLSASTSHAIPTTDETGYKRYSLGLGFTSATEFEAFITTLIDLDLAAVGNGGRRYIPLVDDTALAVGRSRLNGSKGGKAAARNRRNGMEG